MLSLTGITKTACNSFKEVFVYFARKTPQNGKVICQLDNGGIFLLLR
jgi:hypothetical protein